MSERLNPYFDLNEKAFWRSGVGARHFADLENLWDPIALTKNDKIATAGSCFSQALGQNLKKRGARFMDMEPAPPFFETEAEARKWGYGVFSCRYGNIYTSRQLLQLFKEVHGERDPVEKVWEKDGRFFDALRPGIDQAGQETAEDVVKLRVLHLSAVKKMFAEVDLFVFTLGLTEAWCLNEDGTMFPVAPGTIAGSYDPEKYSFKNLRYPEIYAELQEFYDCLKAVNPTARILLTVSPVPMTATATDKHILVATTYSKSVLRSVAGDLSEDSDDIYYFPGYEIVGTHPSRAMYYETNLRNVNPYGVDYVMSHFVSGRIAKELNAEIKSDDEDLELICEEEKLGL